MKSFNLKALAMGLTILIPALLFSNSALALGTYYGVENRHTYTRWYEYPGTYYEEEFVLNGIQAGYFFAESNLEPVNIYYGAEITVHPISWYTSWPDDSASAFGARAGLLAHIDYSLNSDFSLAARGGISYLAAIGFGGDNTFHQDTFGSYLPTIDLGLGVRLKNLNILGSDGLSIFYNFSLLDLGVSTDNWYNNSPDNADWDNYSFSVSLDFGY